MSFFFFEKAYGFMLYILKYCSMSNLNKKKSKGIKKEIHLANGR